MLADYIEKRRAEFDRIPGERTTMLQRLVDYVAACRREDRPAQLTFICTHNSRRSHLAQLWAQAAAPHFGLDDVETYSGGTEATAFAPQAVAALRRAGFRIEQSDQGENPVYRVGDPKVALPQLAFSKVFDQPPNPGADFCAVMTCAEADAGCPIVPGAAARISLPYEDPKAYDGTRLETEIYDARCRQIAREMVYVFSQIAGV